MSSRHAKKEEKAGEQKTVLLPFAGLKEINFLWNLQDWVQESACFLFFAAKAAQ